MIYTLPNGLRAVIVRNDSNVSYIGAMINAGSRDESSATEGLAHFVEHTIFKGTLNRRSYHIASRMESIGGELNAYTTKEETMVYTNAPAGHAPRSFDLLADIIKNSTFPVKEITMEKDVIVEEINSYQDSPSDAVYDDFEELIYAGSGLAHNILGNPESVRGLTSEEARGFIDRFYTPGNMVLYCSDPGDPERNARLIEKYFSDMNFPSLPSDRKPVGGVEPFDISRRRDNHQANCITGTRLFSRTDPRRYALFLLNNYLGGPCMNSRLNMEMRDRRGMVYTVESNVALMSDTGVLLIYYGCDPENTERCKRIIANELDRLAQSPLSDRAFNRAKEQYCGQLIMSGEHRESRAMSLAKSMMYYGEIHDIHYATEQIRNLTPSDLQSMAQYILSNQLSTLVI